MNKKVCNGCDGEIQFGERFIEEDDEIYCEVCYREIYGD